MRAPIGLKFGTLEGLSKEDLSTNCGRNPMNCHGNIGLGKIGPAGPILDTKTGPAGPNLVDQV